MPSKRQRTAGKQKRRNSRKTRRIKRRGGGEEEIKRAWKKLEEEHRIARKKLEEEENARILRREQKGKQMDMIREDYKTERDIEKKEKADNYQLTKKTEEYERVTLRDQINGLMEDPANTHGLDEKVTDLVTFLNYGLDENLIHYKYVRISIAINAIRSIKTKELTNKLAEDIKKYNKEDLKKMFENAIILKLCKLDEAIGQAFIDKDIVKKGKFFGYSIV
uniref:Uncharacterized protein n=1 Tax=viral metagenome TaxID=1070528 RepID=A0A6C0L6N7_9ZZZZ